MDSSRPACTIRSWKESLHRKFLAISVSHDHIQLLWKSVLTTCLIFRHILTPLFIPKRKSLYVVGKKQEVAIFEKPRFLRIRVCRVEAVVCRP